jgi:predicted transcriptional regulator
VRPPSGRLFAALGVCAFVGGCVAGGGVAASRSSPDPGRLLYAPLPHHVPPAPDAASFRFAMVHDVIHERYPRHGPAYYRERERLARERIAVVHPESETAFAETDDVAVAMDRTGRTDEAIASMRDKLKRQTAIGLSGKDLYSTYANLGEFLVHANLWRMMSGDAEARKRVEEGEDLLRKSIAVNPTAHFDREDWHVTAIKAWIDFAATPELLRTCDLIGNRLDQDHWTRGFVDPRLGFIGRPFDPRWTETFPWRNREQADGGETLSSNRRAELRRFIAEVGGETSPGAAKGSERGRRAPFDEPAMWVIGEWREGNGPDPHLALCLGEIMLRVGQRYLAWNCYERASRMADRFWPAADYREFLRGHCQKRQTAIEHSLLPGEAAGLRDRFERELAYGESYQRDYQTYEEQKIQSGANLGDGHFYDEFNANRPPIASKVGPEEWYAGVRDTMQLAAKFQAFWTWGPLVGGVCVFLLTLAVCLFCRPTTRLRLNEVTPPP